MWRLSTVRQVKVERVQSSLLCFSTRTISSLRGYVESARDALTYYSLNRTKDGLGVTIPSQIRYVYYVDYIMSKGGFNKVKLPGKQLSISRIIFGPKPSGGFSSYSSLGLDPRPFSPYLKKPYRKNCHPELLCTGRSPPVEISFWTVLF